MKKKYEVRRYVRGTVYKHVRGELKLCWCWFYSDNTRFSNKKNALHYFTAVNYCPNKKAILKVLKERR